MSFCGPPAAVDMTGRGRGLLQAIDTLARVNSQGQRQRAGPGGGGGGGGGAAGLDINFCSHKS